MAIDFEALHMSIANEQAQAVSGDGGGNERRYWWIDGGPYVWESAFRPEYTNYMIRWAPPADLPGGMRLSSKHLLMKSPNDNNPAEFYCKECFHPRNKEGGFDPEHECYFCEVLTYVSPMLEDIQLQGKADPRGFSGEEVVRCLKKLAINRRVLFPMIVQAKKVEPPAEETFNKFYLKPSDSEDDQYGIILCTNYNSSFYKGMLELYKQSNKKLADPIEGHWIRLNRAPAGKGHKSVLQLDINATPLGPRGQAILAEAPDLMTWGAKPPGPQSSRKCVDVSYREAEHMFMQTLWANDLVNHFTDPADWDN